MSDSAPHTRKIVMVTGAASGIGLAIAKHFSQQGATMALVDRSDLLDSVVEEISSMGVRVQGYKADLADPSSIEAVTSAIERDFSRVDILVNNAGIAPKRADGSHPTIDDTPLDEWELVMAVNVTAPFLLTKWAMELMSENRWGRIINVSSRAGRMYSSAASAAYSASKAAIIGLTRSTAGEGGPFNITANAVAPGRVKTPLSDIGGDSSSQNLHKTFSESVPLRRVGRPEELAAVVSFLASDSSSFMTGAVLDVNGGIFG